MPIIAAVDRTNRTDDIVTEGAQLAQAFNDSLHIVHVLDQSTFISLERNSVQESGKTVPVDEVREMAKTIAEEAVEGHDIDADPVGLVGSPAEEIIKYADRNDASYIVLGGRKQSPVGKALFGSVAQSVLLNTSRPVVTV
ncbi:universal stress protein [Streptomyces sanglieri]